MKIAVIGTGYVGLVTGTCLSESGNEVTCVDIDEEKIENLKAGEIPIYEPGLEELIERNCAEKRLFFTTSVEEAVANAEVVFLAVGTPGKEDGSPNLSYLEEAARDVARHLQGFTIVVIKSTVPVGTAQHIREIISEITSEEFDVVSNPEFLKEGSAVDDFMRPDRVVIGTSLDKAAETMEEIYKPFVRTGNPIIKMDNQSAEITKYAANAYLATRISFINEIALLCERCGADVNKVRVGMGTDSRIGQRFLFPGLGFGGSCFPKDVRAIVRTGKEKSLDMKISRSAVEVNERQRHSFVDKILDYYQGNVEGKKFALWGLAFKPRTDDIREAPALTIIELLTEKGASIVSYDPEAMKNVRKEMGDRIGYASTNYEACEGADALIVATEWNEFRRPSLDKLKELMAHPVIFDGRNIYEEKTLAQKGFEYFCIGVGK